MPKLRLYVLLLWVGINFCVIGQTYFSESFDYIPAGHIPTNWSLGDGGSKTHTSFPTKEDTTWCVSKGYGATYKYKLGKRNFLFINSEAQGSIMRDTITSPVIDLSGVSGTVMLEFLTFYYDHYSNITDSGFIQVYDGNAWVPLDTFAGNNVGSWNAPALMSYDVSAYAVGNSNFQFRFIYVAEDAHYWAIDEIAVFKSTGYNLRAVKTFLVDEMDDCDFIDTVALVVENIGLNDIAEDVNFYYEVVGSSSTVTHTIPGYSLQVGQRDTIYFKSAPLLAPSGAFIVKSWFSLVSNQDGNTANDTIYSKRYVAPTTNFPIEVKFTHFRLPEFNEYHPGWAKMRAPWGSPYNPNIYWSDWLRDHWLNDIYSSNGFSARVHLVSDWKDEWLISEVFIVPTTDPVLRYEIGVTKHNIPYGVDSLDSDDKIIIGISTDCGQSWSILKQYQRSNTPPATGKIEYIDLSSYAGQTARIAFFASEGSTGYLNPFQGVDVFVDNIYIGSLPDNDLRVTSVVLKDSVLHCLGEDSVIISLVNNGANYQTPINVSYQLYIDGVPVGSPVSETIMDTLFGYGDSLVYTFNTPVTASTNGDYMIKAWVSLPNDIDNTNDTAYSNVYFASITNYPVQVDFTGYDSGILLTNLHLLFPGWYEARGAWGNNLVVEPSWWIDDFWLNNPYSPKGKSARFFFGNSNEHEWIISPRMIVPPTNPALKYEIGATNHNDIVKTRNLGDDDTLKIAISTDCGLTWDTLKTYTKNNTPSGTGTLEFIDLSNYIGQTIRIGFYATSGSIAQFGNVDVFIDNINIEELPDNDVGVLKVELKDSLRSCYGEDSVIVTIINYGAQPQSSIDVYYQLYDSNGSPIGAPVVENVQGTLSAVGGTLTYKFNTPVSVPAQGDYKIKAWTSLNTDINYANDSALSVNYTYEAPITSYPIEVDFAGYWGANLHMVFPGWFEAIGRWGTTIVENDSWWEDDLWLHSTSPNGKAAVFYFNENNHTGWIISPRFIVPSNNAALKYDIGATDLQSTILTNSLGDDDTLMVAISTNCWLTWDTLKTYVKTNTPPATGITEIIDLSSYANQAVRIGFYGTDGFIYDNNEVELFIDNINIGVLPDDDIAVLKVKLKDNTLSCLGKDSIVVTLKNLGAQPQSSINIFYQVYNNNSPVGSPVSETIQSTLPAFGGTLTYVFNTPIQVYSTGNYYVKVWTSLNGDVDNSNDTAYSDTVYFIMPNSSIQNDFSGYDGYNLSTVFPGWYEATGVWGSTLIAQNSAWSSRYWLNDNSSPNGNSAVFNLWGSYGNSWIVSPRFVVPTTNPILTYEIGATDFYKTFLTQTFDIDDSVVVAISTDCGSTWLPLKTYDQGNTPPATGIQEYIDLSSYKGQIAMIGFYATEGVYSLGDIDLFIDNINVTVAPDNDVMLQDVKLKHGLCYGSDSVIITLVNLGVTLQDTLNVFYQVYMNGAPFGSVVAETLITVLQPIGGKLIYTFTTPVVVSSNGDYTIKAWVTVDGDTTNTNDTAYSITYQYVVPTNSYPVQVNFNGYTGNNLSILFPGWYEAKGSIPVAANSKWTAGNWLNNAFSPNGTSAKITLSYQAFDTQEWIISPKLKLPNANIVLKYDIGVTDYSSTILTDSLGYDDSVIVAISTDCLQSWDTLMTYVRANTPPSTGTSEVIDLSSYADKTVYIGFYATEGNYYDNVNVDVFLDNINIGILPVFSITLDTNKASIGDTVCATIDYSGNGQIYWSHIGGGNIISGGGLYDTTTCFKITSYSSDTIFICAEVQENGLSHTECDTIVVELTTSLLDLSSGFVEVYPNPVNEIINISSIAKAQIVLYDIKGNIVIEKLVNGRGSIDVSNLSKGVYLLEVRVNGAREFFKVIKE